MKQKGVYGSSGCDSCAVLVTVLDTTPQEMLCTSDYAALWPPNHKMRTIRLVITGTDAVTNPGEFVLNQGTVRRDEPDNASGLGDGNTEITSVTVPFKVEEPREKLTLTLP